MKSLKDRCQQLLPTLVQKFVIKASSQIIPHFTLWDTTNIAWDEYLLFRLDDLMYIAYLCQLKSIQVFLMQLRLSLIIENCQWQVFILELCRYVFLQFFSRQITKQLKKWIILQLQRINQSNFTKMSKLLLGIGKVPSFSNEGRFHKIFFLLNQNSMIYLSHFKEFIKYLAQYVFSISQISTPIDRQHIILRMTKSQQSQDLKNQSYWLRTIWENGWTPLRLMLRIVKTVLKKILDINQPSRVKNILKFSQLVLIRSGHLTDLAAPLFLMIMRKESFNLLSVVDSLRKVVATEINQAHYKFIDSFICNKRRSASMGFSLSKYCLLVQQSFQNSGRMGHLLSEIFCYLIAQQLGINLWQMQSEKFKMHIFSVNYNEDDNRLHHKLIQVDRQLEDEISFNVELAKTLPSIILESYHRASIIRDYISLFVDQAIQNMKDLSQEQNQEIDFIIGIVALVFQQYNFTFKRFCNQLPKFSLRESSLNQLIQISNIFSQKYSQLREKALEHIQNQLYNLKHKNPYPVSIIFPFGQYLYNIAFKQKTLVTFIKKYEFEDKLQVVQSLIRSNNQILKSWKKNNQTLQISKRQGLDRQLGKVAFNIDLGIMEIDHSAIPYEYIKDIIKIHPCLVKFLLYDIKSISHHLTYFILRNHINVQISIIIRKLQEINKKIQNINARQNIILLIHYKYLTFPLELTKSVKISKGIYRIPSIQYMIENQSKTKEFNIRNCKFLVNTMGDLIQTESRFQKIRSKFDTWVGIKGRVPPVDQLKHLFNQDVYLYMGHGSGLEHVQESIISLFQLNCLLLVFGCSSAQMIFDESQPYGCAYQLLLRNCPAYLGCLWTVTDSDIDKVTQYIFENKQHSNLSQTLQSAKPKCTLPYMNGSALVIYGLPSYLIR